ncbi:MAG TPA: hypothetical protein PKO09_12850 [Anaerolineae bacterium]|nr:hypothetical protein [Anaerolineae bacterium]
MNHGVLGVANSTFSGNHVDSLGGGAICNWDGTLDVANSTFSNNQGGTNAQFKGSGLVNGGLDPNGYQFRFMVWAGDGSPDTFRIKIWWDDGGTEVVVYDNGVQQAIGAGNIVIHTQ